MIYRILDSGNSFGENFYLELLNNGLWNVITGTSDELRKDEEHLKEVFKKEGVNFEGNIEIPRNEEKNKFPEYNNPKKEIHLKDTAAKAEYEAILQTLQHVNFNKSKAAELLNIDRKTLYNKIRNFESNPNPLRI